VKGRRTRGVRGCSLLRRRFFGQHRLIATSFWSFAPSGDYVEMLALALTSETRKARPVDGSGSIPNLILFSLCQPSFSTVSKMKSTRGFGYGSETSPSNNRPSRTGRRTLLSSSPTPRSQVLLSPTSLPSSYHTLAHRTLPPLAHSVLLHPRLPSHPQLALLLLTFPQLHRYPTKQHTTASTTWLPRLCKKYSGTAFRREKCLRRLERRFC
jgi:hypothetical protein